MGTFKRGARVGPAGIRMPSTTVLGIIAVAGGIVHAVATVLWYRPIGPIETPSVPLLEATVFGVTFGVLYFLLGIGLRALAGWQPPATEYLLLAISVVGFAVTIGFASGRLGSERRLVERAMSGLLAAMFWLLPLLVLIV